VSRRHLLASAAATAACAALARRSGADEPPARLPVGVVGHGSPMLALDAARGAALTAWAEAMPRPKGVLVVSAHYERTPVTIGATTTRSLVYDFRGFPRALYQVRYAAPGAPRLADEVARRLGALGPVQRDPTRGLDHGAWVPLKWMYADADVPVLPVSLPTHDPRTLWRIGRALRPLRDRGVFVLGSGNATHNLRRVDRRPDAPVVAWAREFDAWLTETVVRHDTDALLDWLHKAPAARLNHPTYEHFVPVILAAAAAHEDEGVRFPVTGFEHGSLSRRSVAWGMPPSG
jgi:4,5-DOPA dioxygenase extradiol